MRTRAFALAVFAALITTTVHAHGPQIQVTDDNGKIVTRQLILDAPYSSAVTGIKTVYVMPLAEFNGTYYSRPNDAVDPILGVSAFPSGPGFAYGYDLADGGSQQFAPGSVLSLALTDRLRRWDSMAFVDVGATQLKAFRGSNVNITSPPENFAVTSDSSPFDSLDLPAVATNYGSEGAEVHSSLRYAMSGDGSDPLSVTPDGVYVVRMQLTSNQNGVAASDPFFFVLEKNASPDVVTAAVSSLGVTAPLVQWLAVPEPMGSASEFFGFLMLGAARFEIRRGQRQ